MKADLVTIKNSVEFKRPMSSEAKPECHLHAALCCHSGIADEIFQRRTSAAFRCGLIS
jgi:hypothetical protein